MKSLSRIAFALLAFTFSVSSPAFAKEMVDMEVAVLRTIDKVSAYTHTFEIPVGKTVKFGSSLYIKARSCRKAPPIETPEDAAFLQIWQRKPDEDKPTWVFSGWMFSSNPSISGVEHPVYDVWVIACRNEITSKSDEAFVEESPDEKSNKDSTNPSDEKADAVAPEKPSVGKPETSFSAKPEEQAAPEEASPAIEED